MSDAALYFLPYMLAVIGFLIVFVLNGIKEEIQKTNVKLGKIETDLHTRVSDIDRRHEVKYVELDRRVATVEGRCAAKACQ